MFKKLQESRKWGVPSKLGLLQGSSEVRPGGLFRRKPFIGDGTGPGPRTWPSAPQACDKGFAIGGSACSDAAIRQLQEAINPTRNYKIMVEP